MRSERYQPDPKELIEEALDEREIPLEEEDSSNVRLSRRYERPEGLSERVPYNSVVAREWREKYATGPTAFFTEQNLEALRFRSQTERLQLLAEASSVKNLNVTPDIARAYFDAFPQDLDVIEEMFMKQKGIYYSPYEALLFVMSGEALDARLSSQFGDVNEIYSKDPEAWKTKMNLDRFRKQADRRNHAPNALLEGFSSSGIHNFEGFMAAGNVFLKAVEEATRASKQQKAFFPKREDVFDSVEYEALTDSQRSIFLQACIKELQYQIVVENVIRSHVDSREIEEYMHGERYEPAVTPLYHFPVGPGTYEDTTDTNAEENNGSDEYGMSEQTPYEYLLSLVLEEYDSIRETEDKDNTIFLVEFWNKNRLPSMAPYVAQALSSQDPSYATQLLMERISEEAIDTHALTAILYRLELGQIGISEEGVTYLEKTFDLGEFNNPGYAARRLTPHGHMGVYGEEANGQRELLGFFDIGDLSVRDAVLKRDVRSFAYETLFTPREGETPQERQQREGYLKEFLARHYDIYGQEFFEATGVRVNNTSLKEQGQLLHFIESSDEASKNAAYAFVRAYGEDGLRSFVSLEIDASFGDRLIEIGERVPTHVVKRLLRTYVTLIEQKRSVRTYIEDQFGDSERYTESMQHGVEYNLMYRAYRLLDMFEKETRNMDPETLEHEAGMLHAKIEKIRDQNHLFLATFKSLRNRGDDVPFEAFRDLSYTESHPREFSEQEVAEMRAMYKANYDRAPHIQGTLIRSFDEKMAIARSEDAPRVDDSVFTLTHQGELVSFLRFTETEKNTAYLGSFNTSTDYTGAALGVTLFDRVLFEQKLKWKKLDADCSLNNPVTSHYIESGFVATRQYDFEGEPAFSIRWEQSDNYRGKTLSRDEIIQRADKDTEQGLQIVSVESQFNLPFDVFEAENKVMTRYFKEGDRFYAVFEKTQNAREEQKVLAQQAA